MKLLCLLFGFVLVRGQLDFYKMPKLQTCQRLDQARNHCLKFAIQKALDVLNNNGGAFLNFPPVQPLEVPQWLMDRGRFMQFDQNYTEIKLYDHMGSTVDGVNFSVNGRDFSLSFDFHNPETTFKAKYQYKNPVLMGMVLVDVGNLTFVERGYNGTVTVLGDVVEEGGLRYVVVKDVRLQRERPVGVSYRIETGDGEHDEKASGILNKNFEELYDDVGEEFKNMYLFAYHNIIDAFFSTIPFDQLFPE